MRPTGYQVLIEPYVPSEKTAGGIIKPNSVLETESVGAVVAKVLAVGPDAYKGERFFEPWCKEGDWVVISRHAGSRVRWGEREVRFVNDDNILATVDDPEEVTRPA